MAKMINVRALCFLFAVTLVLSLPRISLGNIAGEKTGNSGIKFLKNYNNLEYDHHIQNWAAAQDSRGVIYIGNQGGLLEFDGVSWRVIKIAGGYNSVRSLAIDENDNIFIGGNREIGFLEADEKGSLNYVSLVNHLADDQKKFSAVRSTHATKTGVYFESEKFFFRWDFKRLHVWKGDHPFIASFYCNGRLYVQEKKKGLMQINGDSMQMIPGGEVFADAEIFMMAPYDSTGEKLLIATRDKGLFIYENGKSVPFETEIAQYLKEKKLYKGIRLSTGEFALATLDGGLVIIDSRGNLKHLFDKKWGIHDDNVCDVFEDNQGNLWLPLGNGITKIEYASPFVFYNVQHGLPGIVLSVTRHKGVLFAGTTRGLFWFNPMGDFSMIPGVNSSCRSLLPVDDSLLVAGNGGVFQVKWQGKETNPVSQKIIDVESLFLLRSNNQPGRVWLGTRKGLISFRFDKENNGWKQESSLGNVDDEVFSIVENEDGSLWLCTRKKKIIHVSFPGGLNHAAVKSYDLTARFVFVYHAAGHVMFATESGLFKHDKTKNAFIPDNTFGGEFTNASSYVFRIAEDKNKTIWLHSLSKNIKAVPGPGGSFELDKKTFLRIPNKQVNCIYPEPERNKIWFAANDALFYYDTTSKKDCNHDYAALIRNVRMTHRDALIFNGLERKDGQQEKTGDTVPVFEYKDRNLRFEFAAPFFEGEKSTRYRVLLDGYDEDWSPLSSETRKDYTNIDSGSYTFRVKAQNVYGNFSREAVYRFRVLPPWYYTWWAFAFYGLAAFLIVVLIVKSRSRKLLKDKERLEGIVHQRTKEIEDKNSQLQEQSEKLKEMDQIKSRFFANISHEFRTPITLILGPLEQMIADCPDREDERKRKLTLMLRNTQRLLRLINQLLELSRLDSGKMKLEAVETEIISFIKGITDSFRLITQQKELDLEFQMEPEDGKKIEKLMLFFDHRKMEDILSNLLLNAVKFTPSGGKVTVSIMKNTSLEKNFPEGAVEISVNDTGPGIPEEQISSVFDRFFQAESMHENHQNGSGIGLALCKELVELHHGTINARNLSEGGSAFIVKLPLGSTHLEPGEIVEKDFSANETPVRDIDIEEQDNENHAYVEIEPGEKTGESNIVLLVEDSADMRDYIKGAIDKGYTVVEAVDGKEGLEKAREIVPDLIISDIMMPEMDGFELCKEIKTDIRTSHIPVILLTAKASEDNIVEGLETGADDYITKPFSTRILSARIKNLIDIRGQLQQNFNREITMQPVKTSISKIDKGFLRELQEVVNKNLSDPDFNVEEMCKQLYMSNTTLYRKIRALSGQTPTEFIRSCRLKRAVQLFKNGAHSVTEVAFEVGFSSRAYFTKCFKEKFHRLPSEY